jgi:hypothetical protein
MPAMTTFKMTSEQHVGLRLLLNYLAKRISWEEFAAGMAANGYDRNFFIAGTNDEKKRDGIVQHFAQVFGLAIQ